MKFSNKSFPSLSLVLNFANIPQVSSWRILIFSESRIHQKNSDEMFCYKDSSNSEELGLKLDGIIHSLVVSENSLACSSISIRKQMLFSE